MEINKTTNMPKNIPPRATSKVDFRCYPEVKARVKANADARKTSLTKIILEALDLYWSKKATT
jgi:predicted HicB family RNase H-like nuclease